jgi:hypothetical protein
MHVGGFAISGTWTNCLKSFSQGVICSACGIAIAFAWMHTGSLLDVTRGDQAYILLLDVVNTITMSLLRVSTK